MQTTVQWQYHGGRTRIMIGLLRVGVLAGLVRIGFTGWTDAGKLTMACTAQRAAQPHQHDTRRCCCCPRHALLGKRQDMQSQPCRHRRKSGSHVSGAQSCRHDRARLGRHCSHCGRMVRGTRRCCCCCRRERGHEWVGTQLTVQRRCSHCGRWESGMRRCCHSRHALPGQSVRQDTQSQLYHRHRKSESLVSGAQSCRHDHAQLDTRCSHCGRMVRGTRRCCCCCRRVRGHEWVGTQLTEQRRCSHCGRWESGMRRCCHSRHALPGTECASGYAEPVVSPPP